MLHHRSKPVVYFVADALGWVQERRLEYIQKHIGDIKFIPISAARFAILWNQGKLRDAYVYFATWRIPSGLSQSGQIKFDEGDYSRFMTSVTSHYNVGGGLNPAATVASGRDLKETFDMAVNCLRKFKVVTANSRILYDLLSPHIKNLFYAPNGLDTDLFSPKRDREYSHDKIRVGWVGKQKAAKNYSVVEEAFKALSSQGVEPKELSVGRQGNKGNGIYSRIIGKVKSKIPPFLIANSTYVDKMLNSFQRPVRYEDMPQFYHGIDYYLCVSWHEGTPNPALEAAACGVPVVTTRVGNMPDLIKHGENGFFVEPNLASVTKVFDELRKLNAADYKRLSQNIRKSIMNDWTWDKNILNYKKAFDLFFKE